MTADLSERYGDKMAFLFEEEGMKKKSFRDFREDIVKRSEELKETDKTCIAILADGSYRCIVTVFAAVEAGLQVVMMERNLPVDTLKVLCSYTDVDLLYGREDLKEEMAPYLKQGVKGGKGKLLFFTSGTTEQAKAVVLTESSFCASAWNGSMCLPLSEDDILLNVLPLGHVFGFVCGLLWGYTCGACVALGRGPRHYIDDLKYYRPTAVSLVPMLLGFLLQHQLLNEELKLILVGAGDCPDAFLQAVKAKGIRISFGYGLTETSSGVALSIGDDPRAMTICPDDEIRIEEDGEISVKVDSCMMQGYYKRDEDTKAVLQDGWLSTGDLGRTDEDGLLHITGRKKDILVFPDGTKMYLPEYEGKLKGLVQAEEYVIALKGTKAVLAAAKAKAPAEEIYQQIEEVNKQFPRGHQITEVVILPHDLPRTATGKIKRWEIQKEINHGN